MQTQLYQLEIANLLSVHQSCVRLGRVLIVPPSVSVLENLPSAFVLVPRPLLLPALLKIIILESVEGNSEPSHRRFLIFNPLTKQLTNQLTNPLTNQTRQSVIQLNMNSPLPKRARNFQENIPPMQKESSILSNFCCQFSLNGQTLPF